MDNWLTTRRLGILAGLMIVLGVGLHFYQEGREKKEQESKSALYAITQTYDTELMALPEEKRALGTALDVDATFPKTVQALNQMIQEKKVSNRVLFEAAMKLGQLYLDHQEPAKAVEILKRMPEFGRTDFQKASGYFLLGSAQERAGMHKEASESFQAGLKNEVDGLKGEFLLGIVRSLVKSNQAEQAKTYVERLRKDLPGSKALELAEGLLKQ